MRTRRARANPSPPSLFPFLAVLICTMGAIIVLLVLVVKRADIQASEANQTSKEELQQRLERFQDKLAVEENRVELLKKLRPDLKARLDSERAMYGHLADHITRLKQELESRRKELEQLAADVDAPTDDVELKSQIERLKNDIREESVANDKRRKSLANQKQSFAIVPNASGGNGTFRRPIFVECTQKGAILQPYGISIESRDLLAASGPGNPLDVALLMIRDYWNQVDPGQQNGQPYPLFVVRPDGAVSFGAVRKAMRSWVDEFGYELVGQEIDLTYPEVDSAFSKQLAATIEQLIRQQRNALASVRRNEALSQARRLESPSDSSPSYSVSSVQGGFVKSSAGKTRGRGTKDPWKEKNGFNSSVPQNGTNSENSSRPYRPQSSFASQSNGIRTPARNDSPFRNATYPGKSSGSNFQNPSFSSSEENSGATGQFEKSPSGLNSSFQPSGVRNPSATEANSQSPNPSRATGASSNSPSGGSSSASNSNSSSFAVESPTLADSKGKNWALPSKSENAIQIRKPIKIILSENDLKIYEIGKGVKSIPFKSGTASAIPELVEQVWKHIDSWGIAGVNSYWKPSLRTYVSPGGESRFEELKKLMLKSGLDLERAR